ADAVRPRLDGPRERAGLHLPRDGHRLLALDLASLLPPRDQHLHARRPSRLAAYGGAASAAALPEWGRRSSRAAAQLGALVCGAAREPSLLSAALLLPFAAR